MKKLLSLLMVPAFALALTAVPVSVSAQSTSCTDFVIENTGPGSVNQIVCSDDETIVIQCSNGTVINIDVDQDAESGDAENEGNTNGGGANSGDTNNESNLDVDVDNECGSAAEAPATPTTPTTPVTPAEVTPVPAAVTPAKVTPNVTSLPSTGETTPLMIASTVVAAVVAIAAAAKFGLSVYSKSVK